MAKIGNRFHFLLNLYIKKPRETWFYSFLKVELISFSLTHMYFFQLKHKEDKK